MRAVAERFVLRLLALAEPEFLGLLLLEDDGPKLGRLVRAVAERLLLRQAAGAPRIGLARLECEAGGLFLRNGGRAHLVSLAVWLGRRPRTLGRALRPNKRQFGRGICGRGSGVAAA